MSRGRRPRKGSGDHEGNDLDDEIDLEEHDDLGDDDDLGEEEDDVTGAWGERNRWYPPPALKLPPPSHGIKVRKIGATWWGRRWIEALERLSAQYANRLARGRSYARAGRVHDLAVAAGRVRARVTGSRRTPYTVTLRIAALPRAAWTKAVEEMAKQALFSAQLLAGEMPAEIDEAFRQGGAGLFPAARRDLVTDCSCPDVANPCKHVAATHYVLAEAFDRDPFLLFELRGRTKAEVLHALRRARAGALGDGEAAARPSREVEAVDIPTVSFDATAAERYEHSSAALAVLHFRIGTAAMRAAVLRALGAPASWSLAESPVELLGPAYEAAGGLARRLALASEGGGAPAQGDGARRGRRTDGEAS